MLAAHPASSTRPLARPSVRRVDASLGILMGFLLPLVAALLYRTYALSLSSTWLEMTRQLGAPFVAGELAIILYARHRGLALDALWRRIDRPARWALAAFLGTFWISSVFVSWFASFSAALCLIWAIHFLTAAAVFHLVEGEVARGGFAADRFAFGFALGLVALTPIAGFHLAHAPADQGPSTWIFGAPIPGFISIRLFGAWAGAVLALLLGLAWTSDRQGEGLPSWVYPAMALAAGLVVWTGTRASVFGAIVALMGAAVATRGVAGRKFWIKTAVAIVVGTALTVLLLPSHPNMGLLFRPEAMQSADGFSSGRLELWTKSLAVAVDRPWLGHGMGSSWWLVSLGGHYHVQPHNALVQFLLNWGVVPTAAALFLLGSARWRIHGIVRRRPALLALAMMLDFLLAASMLDGMLHFTRFVMLIAVLVAVCLASDRADAVATAG